MVQIRFGLDAFLHFLTKLHNQHLRSARDAARGRMRVRGALMDQEARAGILTYERKE